MIRPVVDSKFDKPDWGSTESVLAPCSNQRPVVPAKKTALRDVQNENRSSVTVSTGLGSEAIKVSGTKRPLPELPISPNAGNAQLVYVRRKAEVESGKSNHGGDATNNNADGLLPPRNLHSSEEAIQPKPQVDVTKINYIEPQIASTAASLSRPSGTSSVVGSLGKSGNKLAWAEPINKAIEMENKQHEDRYAKLQVILKNLDQSDQEDNLQLLRSLSSVELSRYAVELEKRSIQLSLEEAKELLRVGELNVLGKSTTNLKPSLAQADPPEK